jgi:hypothetical protein
MITLAGKAVNGARSSQRDTESRSSPWSKRKSSRRSWHSWTGVLYVLRHALDLVADILEARRADPDVFEQPTGKWPNAPSGSLDVFDGINRVRLSWRGPTRDQPDFPRQARRSKPPGLCRARVARLRLIRSSIEVPARAGIFERVHPASLSAADHGRSDRPSAPNLRAVPRLCATARPSCPAFALPSAPASPASPRLRASVGRRSGPSPFARVNPVALTTPACGGRAPHGRRLRCAC